MKTQRILALAFALFMAFSFNTATHAKGGSGISSDAKFAYSVRAEKGSNKIVLSFDNANNKKVAIKIYNEAKQLVLKETQHTETALRKRYDLSNVGKGTYTVKIETGTEVFTEKIEIGTTTDLAFESVIANHQDKLRVGFANAKGDVVVVITDAAGRVVYNETLAAASHANYAFNLEKLQQGTYQIAVSNQDTTFTENYTVK